MEPSGGTRPPAAQHRHRLLKLKRTAVSYSKSEFPWVRLVFSLIFQSLALIRDTPLHVTKKTLSTPNLEIPLCILVLLLLYSLCNTSLRIPADKQRPPPVVKSLNKGAC